jgi:signal transduction histidine kinase
VVEQGHDGILIARAAVILFANRRLGELLRCEPESLVGRRLEEIVRRPGAEALLSEGEGELHGEDGHRVHVTLRSGEVRIDGAPADLIAIADASERQRMLAQLTRTQKLESVGTLASGMAHDFNNLLGGIVGYAGLLRLRLPADDPARRYVESIERAAGRAAGVTRQLLGIVRDEKARVAPFRVDRVLDEVSRLLRETLDPSIKVEVECADGLPAILGDESQVHQVLLNVCLNARDAMPDGGTLTVRADRLDGCVRVRIRDTGTGMDPETLSKVFDPFFTTKEVGRGSGLGLYMAYRIVERHGGRIDLDSEPGEGTTVEILLPAREAATVEEGERGAGDGVLASGTILLVDDERLMVEVGTEMLRTLGYRVLSASDGREAVEAVRAADGGLCCVIMDVTMPVMDGWEATRRIHELRPDLPVVISSGRDVSSELASETAGFLRKPYGLGELRSALATALSVREPCAPSARAR